MHTAQRRVTRELAQKVRMEGKYLVGREEAWREHPDVAQRVLWVDAPYGERDAIVAAVRHPLGAIEPALPPASGREVEVNPAALEGNRPSVHAHIDLSVALVQQHVAAIDRVLAHITRHQRDERLPSLELLWVVVR